MSADYKKILVPLDGSELAAQALSHAREFVERSAGELILLQVVPDSATVNELMADTSGLVNVGEREQRLIETATAALATVVADLARDQVAARAVVRMGNAAATILDYAREEAVDLIVMSTHGRTGIARWIFGSVADKVLQTAPCPIFLIRAHTEPAP